MANKSGYGNEIKEVNLDFDTHPENVQVAAVSADQVSALIAILSLFFTLMTTMVGATFWVATRWSRNIEHLTAELKNLKEEVNGKADKYKTSQAEVNLGKNVTFNRNYIEEVLRKIEHIESYLEKNGEYKRRKDIPQLPEIGDVGESTGWGMATEPSEEPEDGGIGSKRQ